MHRIRNRGGQQKSADDGLESHLHGWIELYHPGDLFRMKSHAPPERQAAKTLDLMCDCGKVVRRQVQSDSATDPLLFQISSLTAAALATSVIRARRTMIPVIPLLSRVSSCDQRTGLDSELKVDAGSPAAL